MFNNILQSINARLSISNIIGISAQIFFFILLYYYIRLNNKIPDYITFFILIIGIPITIVGTISQILYTKNINKVLKIGNIENYLLNFITHVIPGMYIIYNFKYLIKTSIKTKNALFKTILLILVFIFVNLYIIDNYSLYNKLWGFSFEDYINIIKITIIFCIIIFLLVLKFK